MPLISMPGKGVVMEIVIDYEASWRNSFLDGSNSEPLPKNGRNFIASMSELKKEGNYIKREVTKDTVMGILNRLIGDQRKLYQARNGQYFFKDIEPLVEFDDRKKETGEIVYIRNMNGSTDQNSFSGMIKADDPLFKKDYSNELWSVLQTSFDELCQFILEDGLEESSQFYNYKKIDSKKISSTNILERLNKEIRRRTRVVEIFPSEESYINLVSMLLLEYEENWSGITYISEKHINN